MQAITSTGTCVPVNRYVRPTSRPATCPTTTMAGGATTKTARPGVTTTRDTERNTSAGWHTMNTSRSTKWPSVSRAVPEAQQHAGGDREDDGQQTRHHRQQLDRPLARATPNEPCPRRVWLPPPLAVRPEQHHRGHDAHDREQDDEQGDVRVVVDDDVHAEDGGQRGDRQRHRGDDGEAL